MRCVGLKGDCSDFKDVFTQQVKSGVSDIKLLIVYHCYLENTDLDRIQAAIKVWILRKGMQNTLALFAMTS